MEEKSGDEEIMVGYRVLPIKWTRDKDKWTYTATPTFGVLKVWRQPHPRGDRFNWYASCRLDRTHACGPYSTPRRAKCGGERLWQALIMSAIEKYTPSQFRQRRPKA